MHMLDPWLQLSHHSQSGAPLAYTNHKERDRNCRGVAQQSKSTSFQEIGCFLEFLDLYIFNMSRHHCHEFLHSGYIFLRNTFRSPFRSFFLLKIKQALFKLFVSLVHYAMAWVSLSKNRCYFINTLFNTHIMVKIVKYSHTKISTY
ncbi:uncharacterized protein LOC108743850 [Agrilus planipennis]|uniref:Uncharacterized protein LOC108743850 n=1 Tax=Agrilus planipennis TaxID=224129 RepID=A0A1W4XQA3_AGRPL|nr:uncharacterized protein LOC108743850 [Agrilus planipennis]